MNTLQTILVAVCASVGVACFLFCLAYRFRNELRQLHERWLKMSPLSRAMCILALSVAVLYGGTKPPSSTNEPPTDINGDQPTNNVDATSSPRQDDDTPTNPPPMMCFSPRPMMSPPPELTANNQQLTTNVPWHVRGAYCDWLRIDFPDSFEFPYETNMLKGVTLMAYGELKANLHCSPSTSPFALPTRVSLVPGESSCVYGLTPSNTFLFVWSNVCVNRNPTNRVDASIELFDSGACSVRFDTVETFYPAQPPPGFVGSNQDTNWLAATFSPPAYAAITNKGYEAWLDEDYVGVNEQNGHFRADITVGSLPEGVPTYLVCGPYKVIVTSPGTYSFPLEVFETYKVRTYPVALPLSISTDDGYRDNLAPALLSSACYSPAPASNAQSPTPSLLSTSPVQTASRPRLALSAPPPQQPEYEICETPRLVISPDTIPLDQAVGTHISIWCNVASAARRYSALISREFRLNFCNPSDAEIVAAEVEDLVEIIIDAPLGTCVGTVSITDLHSCCDCGSCTGLGCSCGCACWRHSSSDTSSTNSPSATP